MKLSFQRRLESTHPLFRSVAPGLRWDGGIKILCLCLFLTICPAHARDVASLQGELVNVAGDIRRIEMRLQTLDMRLADLQLRSDELQSQYERERGKMAAAIEAMTRMRRVPKEAVLIRPGGPLQAARTSMLLTASLPAIERQAHEVKALLTELEATRAELRTKTEEARTAKKNLDSSHAVLTSLLSQRALNSPVTAPEQEAIERLARHARSLRDLLVRLEDTTGADIAPVPPTLIPEDGAADGVLPVSGIIRTRYGQVDEVGAKSAGLTIECLPESVVVAPLPGVMRFIGPFKGYGNIAIIAHAGGYYSLVAGLGTIYVQPGQAIVSGEPIGILDADKNQNQTDQPRRKNVYYELRLNGDPVDPARKLPDLG